ncbi:hypothetical protein BC835DRAFT_413962 [Cytidiella melzeri]|nr:hypothetical protein BC835DRAFT_413962 [Cytidiella melzeri]
MVLQSCRISCRCMLIVTAFICRYNQWKAGLRTLTRRLLFLTLGLFVVRGHPFFPGIMNRCGLAVVPIPVAKYKRAAHHLSHGLLDLRNPGLSSGSNML